MASRKATLLLFSSPPHVLILLKGVNKPQILFTSAARVFAGWARVEGIATCSLSDVTDPLGALGAPWQAEEGRTKRRRLCQLVSHLIHNHSPLRLAWTQHKAFVLYLELDEDDPSPAAHWHVWYKGNP